MIPWKRLLRFALACIGCALLGVALLRLGAEPLVARRAAARLSTRLGSEVTVARARLRLPARVLLTDVRSARGGAREVEVDLSPSALLVTEERIVRVVARDVIATGYGAAERVELDRDPDGREHLAITGARHDRLPISFDSLRADLDDDRVPTTLDLRGAAWDGVPQIEAHATRDSDTWTAHVTWPGLRATLKATTPDRATDGSLAGSLDGSITGNLARTTIDAELYLNDAPLPAHLLPRPIPWLDLSSARATGTLRVTGNVGDAAIQVGLAARGITLDHPALSSSPARGLAASLTGSVHIGDRGRRIDSDRIEARSGAVAVVLSGQLDRDGASSVTADLGVTHCTDALAALAPLLPALDGMQVEGDLAGHVHVEAHADRLTDLSIESEIAIGCEVTRDAPAADPGRLALMRASAALTLDPVRPLAEVGLPVVRAFLLGEDARFFRHHGFDPWTIRRALAADLAAGAFDRGASTITQQLARNLFLDGDRNVSRKIEEAIIAWRLEQVADKREMLEAWLHLIELGPEVHGVVAGALYWFGKDVSQLDDDQAARLAALAPAPRRGLDEAWSRRYRDLAAKMPGTHIDLPASITTVTPSTTKVVNRPGLR